jgi:6-phosphogluconolactonase (cycloisomerase 2 family)
MQFSLHLLPFLVASFLLCSCGGGSSDATAPDNSSTPPQANQNPPPAVGAPNSFAYVINPAGVSAFKIDGTTGNLTFVSTLPAPAGFFNGLVAVHPSGKFAYVFHATNGPHTGSPGESDVTEYRINPDGTFTPVDTVVALVDTFCMTVHPSGQFLYVVRPIFNDGPPTDFIDWVVVTYAINPNTGALSAVGESIPITLPLTASAGREPRAIFIDPSGRFAYLTIWGNKPGTDEIQSYTINQPNGILTPVAAPYSWVDRGIDAMTLHPSGKFAYVAFIYSKYDNDGMRIDTHGIQAYTIEDNGALTEVGSAAPAGVSPAALLFAPGGRFLYSANGGYSGTTADVWGYETDPATGLLTSLGSVASAGPPGYPSMSLDPSEKFVYVVDHDSEIIRAFTIDPVTGNLTPSGAPMPINIPDPNYGFAFITIKVSN